MPVFSCGNFGGLTVELSINMMKIVKPTDNFSYIGRSVRSYVLSYIVKLSIGQMVNRTYLGRLYKIQTQTSVIIHVFPNSVCSF